MRLRRLGLARYGLFDGRRIEFGPAPEDAPDLHVIYGPNEAGKSTALAGFLDLLFGFEHRSPYAFLHGYDAMRVEADLDLHDTTRPFVRIRKRRGSLLDGDGRPVPEGALANALGGMTRETYKAMFSLDDDTLEAGGDEILRSEGDLGSLLFSGGAGLLKIREKLKKLREDADRFHRESARKTELRALISRLATLAEEKKRLDTAAPAWVRLVEEQGAARKAYEETAATVAELETARADAARRLAALPWLAEIRRLREELAGLAALPEPPKVWFDRIGALLESEPRLTARIDGLEKQRKRLEEKRAALPVDDAARAIEDDAARRDFLRGRYATARDDLPRRRDRLAELKGTIGAILRRLERPAGADPASLLVPAAVAGALGELIERRSGVEERLRAATAELETSKAGLDRAAAEFDAFGAAGAAAEPAFERLGAALADARKADWRTRLEVHVSRLRRLSADLDGALERLNHWSGDADTLARVETPEAGELAAWRSALEKDAREIERLEAERDRIAAEREDRTALAEAARARTGLVDDDEAAALRAARDAAWQRHREALDAGTAAIFEDRMDAWDAAADVRLTHAEALARVRQAGEDLRAANAALKRNAAQLERARRRRRTATGEIAASVAAMIRAGAADMPPGVGIERLAAWIDRRTEILATLDEARREEREIERAREDETRLRARLAGALAAVGAAPGPAADVETLTAAAQAAVDAERDRRTKAAAARRRLESARGDIERRRAEARRAQDGDNAWRGEWAAALARCRLGEIDPAPTAAEARRILEDTTALEIAHAEHAELTRRIAAMERDRATFVAEVNALADRLGEPFDADRVLAHDDALKKRLAEELARRKTRDELAGEIDAVAAERSRAGDAMAELRAEAGRMFEAFGVGTLRAVEAKLGEAARRAGLRETLAAREADLAKTMGAASPREAEDALAGTDRDALEARAAEIAAKLEDAAARKQALFHSLQKAGDALAAVGGDAEAARIEQERRTIFLQIEEEARDWLRIRLGVAAAERALDDYRRTHRSSMMRKASEAFRIVSRGAYSELDSQLTDKGEILIGVPAAGGAKMAPDMSKGTRFQLYLALRVAGYREFVENHGPVPFIADDILETFDDLRAEEAFRLFAGMAGSGQVIYLSHHRHLCDIAREVCPSARVHELPDPNPAPAP